MADKKRLIDANWILGEIEHDLGCYELENVMTEDGLYVELRDVVRMVCAAPTVDAVEVVHGRWEPHMEEMEDGFGKFEPVQTGLRCSVCGRYSCCGGNFCKDCGAKMDLEVSDGKA